MQKKSLSNGGGSLNLDNVKCFISLAECLNFTKAAEKEHMTQTSMSRKISGLEEELGVRLFSRDNHQVILTDAGSEFYVQAQKLLDVYESTVRLVQNVEQGYARSLKIGVGIYEDELLDTFLGQYVMAHPDVRITCLQYSYRELLKRFEQGLLDIIVTSDQFLSGYPVENVDMELIYDKPWKIILNREHPLAERTAVTSEDLKNEIMITMYEGSVSQIADHFRTAFKFRDIIHVNSYNTKLMMVNANLGFGLVPAFVRLVRYEKIKMKEFAPPYISRCFYALCHKENQNGHVREFFEDYVKYAQEERD